MGISTVAVFSDADADALHVQKADTAVRIGPAPSRESYLSIEKIIAAAKKSGATAVHPGYGFLSENAELAAACQGAGLIFVGPPPEAIRVMGSKREAKRIAREADVPVVPGYEGADQSPAQFAEAAQKAGYPVLLKASAGGGGKGMRIVRSAAELSEAIQGATREATSAFGDGTLLLEKYIEQPRHIEIQILGDAHGNLVHLFERECSIQRRHQKIIEESPSTAIDPALREKMGAAAVRIARAIGYTNAGTVEFIVGPDGAFYFLEVNTRLQVEHPVTERVTGLDLVREQIRIARGEPLGYTQASLSQRGHAIEVRLYAESPARGFLPSSGTLVDWDVTPVPGLRVDGGVSANQEISIHYDPLLAKLITHGETREEAIDRMLLALGGLSAQGVDTNQRFLGRVLEHPEFRAGRIHTHFIEQHMQEALAETPSPSLTLEAAVAATIHDAITQARGRTVLPSTVPGFRNSPTSEPTTRYIAGDATIAVSWRWLDHQRLSIQGSEVRIIRCEGPVVRFEEGGLVRDARVVARGDRRYVRTHLGALAIDEVPRFPQKKEVRATGAAIAPMPGKVVLVAVKVGDTVARGATLVVLEAMKMEHTVRATEDGSVTAVSVASGDQVQSEQALVVVTPA